MRRSGRSPTSRSHRPHADYIESFRFYQCFDIAEVVYRFTVILELLSIVEEAARS